MSWPRSCKAVLIFLLVGVCVYPHGRGLNNPTLGLSLSLVIPAKAGVHSGASLRVHSRLRENDRTLNRQVGLNSQQETCAEILTQESRALRYEVVYSLYSSKACAVDSIVWVMKAAAYYSYQAEEQEKASRFLEWIKGYYDERERLYAIVYLLQTSHFSVVDIEAVIQSFNIVIYKRAAFLELISYYPFPALIDKFVRWRKRYPGIPWTDLDQLVLYTHRLIFTRSLSAQGVKEGVEACLSITSVGPPDTFRPIKFWKEACAYHALRRSPRAASLAQPLLDAGVASGIFQIIHRVKDLKVFRWISY